MAIGTLTVEIVELAIRSQHAQKLLGIRKNLETLYSLVLQHGTEEQDRKVAVVVSGGTWFLLIVGWCRCPLLSFVHWRIGDVIGTRWHTHTRHFLCKLLTCHFVLFHDFLCILDLVKLKATQSDFHL